MTASDSRSDRPIQIESTTPSFLDDTVTGFLEQVSRETPAPGGGAVAAIAAALAAALAGMAARFAGDGVPEASDLAERADALRARAAPLADADAASYEAVLAALRTPRGQVEEARAREVQGALSTAADVPLAVAVGAAEASSLAAELAESGNANLKGDAAAAALMGEAAARIATVLVEINLAGRDDERIEQARALEATATSAARRAITAAISPTS